MIFNDIGSFLKWYRVFDKLTYDFDGINFDAINNKEAANFW